MATNIKSLQLLRNTKVFATKEAATTYLSQAALTSDGTPILARYEGEDKDGNPVIKTLLGIQAIQGEISGASGSSYITIIDVDGTDEQIEAIIERLNTIADELSGKTGVIKDGSETVEEVLQDIIDTIKNNKVVNLDSSIDVEETSAGTVVSLAIQDGETVLANSGTGIYTDIKIEHDTDAEQSENVKEAFKLTATDGTKLGETIKIYKDSALEKVYIGHVDDYLTDEDPETHESPTTAVTEGSGETALCFIYQISDGNYTLTAIDIEEYLKESEFKDGLETVSEPGHTGKVVKVKIDATSEAVSIAEGAEDVPVLTVSLDGVKVDNIQKAIDSKAVTSVTLSSQDVDTEGVITRAEDGSGVSINIEQGGNVIKLTDYQPIELGTGEELKVLPTDTVNDAIAKIEAAVNNNEKVTAEALIDLQEQLDEIGVSGVTNVILAEGDETIPVYPTLGNGIVVQKDGSVVKLGFDPTKVSGVFDFGVYSVE